jgi:hypothetical protein
MNEIDLVDFIDWYNVMHEDVNSKTSEEVKNMYYYYLNNKL